MSPTKTPALPTAQGSQQVLLTALLFRPLQLLPPDLGQATEGRVYEFHRMKQVRLSWALCVPLVDGIVASILRGLYKPLKFRRKKQVLFT